MGKTQEQILVDRFEIIDVFNRYATGADKCNYDIYRSCFADELEVDLNGDCNKLTAEAWIEQAFSGLGCFKKTQHMIANHSININGDEAEADAYLQAHHFNEDGKWSVWGSYSNKLIKTPEGWRIYSLKLTFDWQENS